MTAIEIDFDVYKALTNLRANEADSYNDVLRRLLKLSPAEASAPTPHAWSWKGVTLPEGTELKAEYKGKAHTARITDGAWRQDGKEFGSPSAAAYEITGAATNGWRFWQAKRPGDISWIPLSALRIV